MKLPQILKCAIGFMSLSLGAVGLVLPVWPTTPFVLLALGCFSTMPSVQAKILRVNFFREYYEGYTTGCGLTPKTIIISLSFLWGMLLISMFVVQRSLITAILLLVGTAVTIHILWIARKKRRK